MATDNIDILAVLNEGESELVEFKTSFDKETIETLVAFANTRGGQHINRAYIISGKPQRDERWEYPLAALREIVLNAIIHRDYTSSSDSVVKIFDDRIEFFNPGRLPDGLTVGMLLKGHYRSTIRNRKIADMFKEAGLVEK